MLIGTYPYSRIRCCIFQEDIKDRLVVPLNLSSGEDDLQPSRKKNTASINEVNEVHRRHAKDHLYNFKEDL